MTHHIDLDTLVLAKGAHGSRTDGVCLLEAVAWWVDTNHTDSPRCVSPVLADFGRRLNDVLPDDRRQELRPLITQLPGTTGDGLDETRGYLASDWLWHWLIGTSPSSPVYDRDEPYICELCRRGHHVHEVNSGRCTDLACDCGGAS